MKRLGVAIVCLLLLPASAHAALPAAHPPGKSVAGVKIAWPLTAAETTQAPGASLSVRVRSSHRRAQLTLARVDGRGRALHAVARRTLRSGTFTVRLPALAGARYALRLTVAGKHYWSWILTPAPKLAPVTTPSIDCGQEYACETGCAALGGAPNAEIAVTPATARPGDAVQVTIVNRGAGCLISPDGNIAYWEQQLSDGSWEPAGHELSVQVLTLTALPGATWTGVKTVGADFVPGAYRLVVHGQPAVFAAIQVLPELASLACDIAYPPPDFVLDPGAVRPGDQFTYRVAAGWGPFRDDGGSWQRLRGDGTWEPFADGWVEPTTPTDVGSGGSLEHRASLPADVAPGSYRVVENVAYRHGNCSEGEEAGTVVSDPVIVTSS
jgi:hypothetical protein